MRVRWVSRRRKAQIERIVVQTQRFEAEGQKLGRFKSVCGQETIVGHGSVLIEMRTVQKIRLRTQIRAGHVETCVVAAQFERIVTATLGCVPVQNVHVGIVRRLTSPRTAGQPVQMRLRFSPHRALRAKLWRSCELLDASTRLLARSRALEGHTFVGKRTTEGRIRRGTALLAGQNTVRFGTRAVVQRARRGVTWRTGIGVRAR